MPPADRRSSASELRARRSALLRLVALGAVLLVGAGAWVTHETRTPDPVGIPARTLEHARPAAELFSYALQDLAGAQTAHPHPLTVEEKQLIIEARHSPDVQATFLGDTMELTAPDHDCVVTIPPDGPQRLTCSGIRVPIPELFADRDRHPTD